MLDQTTLFRQLLAANTAHGNPPAHRARRRRRDRAYLAVDCKQFALDASKILLHIRTLSQMLSNVRAPYLNLSAASSSRPRITPSDADLLNWKNVQSLTNDERDQIDSQAKQLLSKCSDRVREMERLVKEAQESRHRSSGLLSFLPAAHSERNAAMDFEAAHLAGITLHLSHELASVSQQQTEMQEQRRNLQMEQTQTLASTAQRELAAERVRGEMPAQPPRYPGDEYLTAGASGWFSQHASSIASSITGLAPKDLLTPREPQASFTHAPLPPDDDESDSGDLTEAQLHVFESENAALLRTVQSNIAALQQAESRLLEISALQSELVVHLTQQTELTDQLYEDAIASTDLVQRGNLQLKEARRRSKDSRLFILVFLIGASFALLFLHYY